jgi:hypothetical protein
MIIDWSKSFHKNKLNPENELNYVVLDLPIEMQAPNYRLINYDKTFLSNKILISTLVKLIIISFHKS